MPGVNLKVRVKFQLKFNELLEKERKKSERALFKAGAFIRKDARRSIKKRKASSLPGKPPTFRNTDSQSYKGRYVSRKQAKEIEERGGVVVRRKGQGGILRRSIFFAVNKAKHSTVVGPTRFAVGPIGNVLEHGGELRGRKYKPRPFMRPALAKAINTDKLSTFWKNLLKA